MHPNPLFRSDDRALMRDWVGRVGFGTLFLTTPEGPRVAHAPLLLLDGERLQFHLSRGNALTRHLAGATALATVTGPQGYISPRWYAVRDAVPTWDYVAIEMEGAVRRLEDAELDTLLYDSIDRHENRLGGERWSAKEAGEALWNSQFKGIVGFELAICEWRPTVKLSQKRSAAERAGIAAGLERAGNAALATAMHEHCA